MSKPVLKSQRNGYNSMPPYWRGFAWFSFVFRAWPRWGLETQIRYTRLFLQHLAKAEQAARDELHELISEKGRLEHGR